MKCAKCGSENPDGTKFCGECGEPLVSYERVDEKTSEKTEINVSVKKKRKKWKIVGAILVVLCIIGMIPTGSNNGGADNYEELSVEYFEAMYDQNVGLMLDFVPDKVISHALEKAGYSSEDKDLLVNEITEMVKKSASLYDKLYGADWTTTCEYVGAKDLVGGDLEVIQNYYSDAGIDLTEAKRVTVKVTWLGEDRTEEYGFHLDKINPMDISMNVIKVNGLWYVDLLASLESYEQEI